MSTQLVLPAPAKLNLFLHIIGQREDGYHQLQTLFQFVDYGDELTFELADKLTLSSNNPALETDDNLIIKAARLLQEKTNNRLGASIHLLKKLPMGGGVGGGSSDAATTLLALNALWRLNLSMDELADIGLKLGADVPVFVRGKAAFGEGIGEVLTPVNAPEDWYLVLVPEVHVETIRMFQHKDLTRDTPAIKVCAALEQNGQNDFEPLVRRLYPEVRQCLALLERCDGSGSARMSGSGACAYIPFACRQQAEAAQSELAIQGESNFTSFVAHGKNCSTLHTALAENGYSIPE
ncbi:4-(cytidine 5'-diphospho)-2-C-methyl-D-erythritol kinase [Endozoicomonas sp. (ex Bugula neritina AB1)]|nr:4-(cytidine 5'-diphospho)-2-C-methyl-D-erythritol kinase [Endozoicomonas sp. (ex Bugula neritina AB1)]